MFFLFSCSTSFSSDEEKEEKEEKDEKKEEKDEEKEEKGTRKWKNIIIYLEKNDNNI